MRLLTSRWRVAHLHGPGDYHATATPDKFHPAGGPLTPQEGAVSSLQQHYAFFDMWEWGRSGGQMRVTGGSGAGVGGVLTTLTFATDT